MLAMYLAMLETGEDQQRFTRLYEAYERKVYAVALRILGDPDRAEDAAQQTWFQLLKNWERVSALAWPETEGYTVTAAKNAALDMLRAERRTTAFPENWDPPAREERQEEYDYLVSLIRALPEGYRRILELKCVEEQSNREIARRLGINESTVASRVMRGRAMLQEQLEIVLYNGQKELRSPGGNRKEDWMAVNHYQKRKQAVEYCIEHGKSIPYFEKFFDAGFTGRVRTPDGAGFFKPKAGA